MTQLSTNDDEYVGFPLGVVNPVCEKWRSGGTSSPTRKSRTRRVRLVHHSMQPIGVMHSGQYMAPPGLKKVAADAAVGT